MGCMHACGEHLPLEKCKKRRTGHRFLRIGEGKGSQLLSTMQTFRQFCLSVLPAGLLLLTGLPETLAHFGADVSLVLAVRAFVGRFQIILPMSQAKEALAQAAEAEAASVQKDETIAAQAQEIEVLKADSGAAVVASLEQAYEEGVESNG